MYRLLIVDNEEFVVNGLVDLFSSEQHHTIEAIGSYSAAEALNILMTTHMDIVITDIRMPRMNGLELQEAIRNRWPYCKVIFLSGYNDFDYAQEAMRNGAVNYILKTEDDEVIVKSVYDAIDLIVEEKNQQLKMIHALQAIKEAEAVLQKEYIESLCIGNMQAYNELDKRLKQLNLPLIAEKPLYIVIGKVDDWSKNYSKFDQSLLLYAIQNVASEYLTLSTVHYAFIYERSMIVWLIQSKAESWIDHLELSKTIKMTSNFIYGTFESIQSSCRELIQVSISFASSPQAISWKQLESELDQLKNSLSFTLKKQQLVFKEHTVNKQNDRVAFNGTKFMKIYENLIYDLEHRNENKCREAFEEILSIIEALYAHNQWLSYTRWTSMLSSLLLERLEEFSNLELPEWLVVFSGNLEQNAIIEWPDLARNYLKLINFMFDQQQPAREREENELVQKIHRYIEQNLGGDISLKTMAYVIGHNPSYLSRLYKNKAGKQLSETINEIKLQHAKKLLEDHTYRISDVSKSVGFLSEHYFYRFFKKLTNLTPQEYRLLIDVKKR